jgi:hypothetical protein
MYSTSLKVVSPDGQTFPRTEYLRATDVMPFVQCLVPTRPSQLQTCLHIANFANADQHAPLSYRLLVTDRATELLPHLLHEGGWAVSILSILWSASGDRWDPTVGAC